MSHEVTIHQAQRHILRELLFVKTANFAVLQKTTGLTSDHFKFHVKRLLDASYIEKLAPGSYCLTSAGKEYANKLDTDRNTIERQPKSAVILVAEKGGKFLLQERLKHPYFGFWGFPGGKIRWGETILQAAAREIYEETGLSGIFTHQGIYHEHATESETGTLLEDKIFHIVRGTSITGTLANTFDGGRNAWLTLAEARAQQKKYASFDIEAAIGLGEYQFIEATQHYSKNQF